MNFELSEEQQMIRDSVARFVLDNYNLEERIKKVESKSGYSEEHWQVMAGLGWLGLTVPGDYGGFDGNQIDTMVVMEELGKGLVVEPYFANVLLGVRALVAGNNKHLIDKILAEIIEGRKKITVAYQEEQSGFHLHDVVTHATADNENFILNGRKCMISNAETSDYIIISARTSGGQMDRDGITLFLVPTASEGLSFNHFPVVDGSRASEVTIDHLVVPAVNIVGVLDDGYKVLEEIEIDAILALSAEAVGVMEVLYKDTVEYIQVREQFDHPLADFQVLQHRMVDMFVSYEQCKSMLLRATLDVVDNGTNAKNTVHALKHLIGKLGLFVAENAVQTHGGMGMTEELSIGHFFKRLLVIDSIFGNADYHLEQFSL